MSTPPPAPNIGSRVSTRFNAARMRASVVEPIRCAEAQMRHAGGPFDIGTYRRTRRGQEPHAAFAIERRRRQVEPRKRESSLDERRHDVAEPPELAEHLNGRDDVERHAPAEIDRKTRISQRRQVIHRQGAEAIERRLRRRRGRNRTTLTTATTAAVSKRMTFLSRQALPTTQIKYQVKRERHFLPSLRILYARFPVLHRCAALFRRQSDLACRGRSSSSTTTGSSAIW